MIMEVCRCDMCMICRGVLGIATGAWRIALDGVVEGEGEVGRWEISSAPALGGW